MAKCWLLTWNQGERWDEWEELPEIAEQSMNGSIVDEDQNWSVMNTKSVQVGDKVYLLRQGEDRPGLVATGIAYSAPETQEHWDGSGKKTNYIDIAWTAVLDPDIHPPLHRDELNTGVTGFIKWNTQRSGISIDGYHPEAIQALDGQWEDHLLRVWRKPPELEKRIEKARGPCWEFKICRDLFYENDEDGCIKGLKALIEKSPEPCAEHFTLLGDAHDWNEEYPQAINAYTEVLDINPNDIYALSKRASVRGKAGEYVQAIEDYTALIRSDGENEQEYLFLRGEAYQGKGSHAEAIIDFTGVINIDEENAGAYEARARSYKEIGDDERALADREKYRRLTSDEESPEEIERTIADLNEKISDATAREAWNLDLLIEKRGQNYLLSEEYDKAIEDFSKVIDGDLIAGASPLSGRARAYSALEEHDKAIKDFSKAIRIISKDPEDEKGLCEAYNLRGLAYNASDEHDKAIRDFTKAIRIDAYFGIYYNRGRAYLEKGSLDKAIKDFTQEIADTPDDPEYFYYRGLAYFKKGKLGKALDDLDEAIRLNPYDADTYQLRGEIHQGLKEEEKAQADFKEAKDILALEAKYAGGESDEGAPSEESEDEKDTPAEDDQTYQEPGDEEKAQAKLKSVADIFETIADRAEDEALAEEADDAETEDKDTD